MKKYNLKLKEEYIINGFDINGLAKKLPNRYYSHKWLTEDLVSNNIFAYTYIKSQFIQLTQQEIDELPYGFVKMHDIIEVKEQFYYIKLPYINSDYNYLSESIIDGDVGGSKLNEFSGFKMRFTKEEIEEKYPLYANDTCMIKVEDVK